MEAIAPGRRRIVVVGMGHVGGATAAWLLRDGHEVVAVEADHGRRSLLCQGSSAPPYASVGPALAAGRRDGRLTLAAELTAELLVDAEFLFVCVGTPLAAEGSIDIGQVMAVTRALADLGRPARTVRLTLVYRSTLPVGTTEREILPLLGQPLGDGLEIALMPEFLREAHALEDVLAPTRIVLGERTKGVTRQLDGLLVRLGAPVLEVGFATAELAKLVDNGWHALKVTFANEIGRLADGLGLDPRPIEDILLADWRLNVSAAYLRHGMPFGGSCLPKDVAALAALGVDRGAMIPALASILASNRLQHEHIVARIGRLAAPPARILLLGWPLAGTARDVQASPLHALARALLDRGYVLRIVDRELDGAALYGTDPDIAASYRVVLQSMTAEREWIELYAPRLIIIGCARTMLLPDLPADTLTLRLGHS